MFDLNEILKKNTENSLLKFFLWIRLIGLFYFIQDCMCGPVLISIPADETDLCPVDLGGPSGIQMDSNP